MKERPFILAVLPGLAPSTLMDVVTPLKQLQQAGQIYARVTLDWLTTAEEVSQADLVVFCRNNNPAYDWSGFCAEKRIPFIYDLDDNLFAIPASTPLGQYANRPDVIETLKAYLRGAALARVYSPALREVIAPLNANTRLVQPPIDWGVLDGLTRKPGRGLKLVYPTSRGSADDLAEIFIPAIQQILKDYPRGLEIFFLGAPVPRELRAFRQVRHWKFDLDYEKYLRRFYHEGFDIGLAPLKDDLFHQCKTNNKYREFAACGIAGIYSKTTLYQQSVRHAQTGLLVENTAAAWHQAIRALIENPELRRSIQASALQDVQNTYPREAFANEWLAQIRQVLEEAPISMPAPAVHKQPAPPQGGSAPASLLSRVKNLVSRLRQKGMNDLVESMRWKMVKAQHQADLKRINRDRKY